MDPRRQLLIPLDDSSFSRTILPHVRRWFAPDSVALTLLRVVPAPVGRTSMPPRPVSSAWTTPMYASEQDVLLARHPIYASQEHGGIQAGVAATLEAEVRALRAAGYVVAVEAAYGDPAEAIVAAAIAGRADMVAMATHARTGLGYIVSGSVAEAVLRKLDIPVFLIHPPA
jgi:nucleotide-binding universal stress UspA family protein